METQRICPNCRKPLPPDVPLGLCPECLIKSGFPTETGPGVSGEAAGARFEPPPIDEIARLFPQLEILGLIGKGGMGAVYKARQPMLDRFIALKVLPPAVANDSGFAERFNREARALARLNHPNIVAVYDFGKAGDLHYLLMEFVDGTNLREVERAGKLSAEQALAIVPKICEALQYAHDQGVVHRDVKPENILLDKSGRVKIADFGIAKMVGQGPTDVSLTGARDVVGTPHYMAPEQVEHPQAVDHRADIYSLGVVFYEMLTGELPLGKFAVPSKKVQIDVRLDEVVLHTLEKEPSRRYQQVSQVKTDVETIAGTRGSAGKSGAASLPFAGQADRAASDKAILPALLLAFPFGLFGAHRFYVGKIGTAFLQLGALAGCILLIVACAAGAPQPLAGLLLAFLILGCLIWAVTDWILILCKAFTDGQGRRMSHWLHPQNGYAKIGASPMTGPPSSPLSGGAAPPAGASPQPPPGGAASPPSGPPPGETPPAAGAASPVPPIAPHTTTVANSALIIAPAVGLLVAAIWKLLSALLALFFVGGLSSNHWLGQLKDFGIDILPQWGALASFSIVLFKVVPALLILLGAFQMLRLRSYAWALTAAILSIVACSLIGLPMGIWALIVLARQEVRETFANAARSGSPKTNLWPWVFGTALVAGVFILVALGLNLAGGTRDVTVSGTVADAVTGQPIAGARVDDNRYGADTDKPPAQAWTDAKGQYELNTSYEEHTIAASAPGYETTLSTLLTKTFGSERKVRMNFSLQPAPANAAVPLTSDDPATNESPKTTVSTPPPRGQSQRLEDKPLATVTQTVSVSRTPGEPQIHQQQSIGNLSTTDPFQQAFNETLPLSTQGRLSLDNVTGRIKIAGWDRNEVILKALKHGKTQESVEAVKINVDSSPDEIVVHTEQPSTGPSGWFWFGDSKRNDASVDYLLQVPQHVHLNKIASVNGQIEIDGVAGDTEASTVNGRVQVQGAGGSLKVSTVNGRIETELVSLGGSQSVLLNTVNGAIEVTLPVNADADVNADTLNGGMNSEFPELVVKKDFPLSRHLKGTLGKGGATVKATTVNGSIHFQRGH